MIVEDISEVVIDLKIKVLPFKRQVFKLFAAKNQQIKDKFQDRQLASLEVGKISNGVDCEWIGHGFEEQFVDSNDIV